MHAAIWRSFEQQEVLAAALSSMQLYVQLSGLCQQLVRASFCMPHLPAVPSLSFAAIRGSFEQQDPNPISELTPSHFSTQLHKAAIWRSFKQQELLLYAQLSPRPAQFLF